MKHKPHAENGRRLRAMRKAAGKTQAQVASEVGVSAGAYSQWETGMTMPRAKRHQALADSLGGSARAPLAPDPEHVLDIGGMPEDVREWIEKVARLGPRVPPKVRRIVLFELEEWAADQ